MAAATCQAQIGTGSSVSWASAEGGVKFNRADSATDSTPVPIPTSTGTNFSWIKNLVLAVTVAGTSTSIRNRRVSYASSPSLATGLGIFYKSVAVASYAQAASGNMPAASGSNFPTSNPAGYTAMSTTPTQYDDNLVSTGSTGPNGTMIVCVLGVDNTYTGGPNSNTTLPQLTITYDEQ